MPGFGSSDPLFDAKLLEFFYEQGVRHIVYDGEGDFTSEHNPANDLRNDALIDPSFSDGD